MPSVITLTTDFGLSDAYVACMKGVILSINPKATIVDISHSIEPQNVVQAAFMLHIAHRYFPNNAIHVVIVDPEVGSKRRAIILLTPLAYFVAPDNGVLSYIINELHPLRDPIAHPTSRVHLRKEIKENIKVISITNSTFWHQPVSSTFHGRDIFAPVAAHLSLGVPIQKFGKRIDTLNIIPPLTPDFDSADNLVGHVLHIDHFGNLITNIKNIDLSKDAIAIRIGRHLIKRINRYYAEVEGLAVIPGSSGHLEISLSNGNAASFLRAKIGDQVKLTIQKKKL
jgi:S-adenosylmethionine hydrolase